MLQCVAALLVATQDAAVASINLETSCEDLSSLRTFWQLQPFTNDEAVAWLQQATTDAAE